MKYCVVIIDGAAGWPLPEYGGKTCLELACTPNMDAMAKGGRLGLVRTVPSGMEPSSACACMSILGYDPVVYYRGRSAIEALSMGNPVTEGETAFRCNLVTVVEGKMRSHSAGHISSEEARRLVAALNDSVGTEQVHFYPGVSYRHLCKIVGREDTLLAECTPPHNIPDKDIREYLPRGQGSDILRDLMVRSEPVLERHPVNVVRVSRGDLPATMIWLFWGSGALPEVPFFRERYGVSAALTSGVDLLRGLARMAKMSVLDIPGVTDDAGNDYAAQARGALTALEQYDLVVIHIEAPDEAGHAGSVEEKVDAIQRTDDEVVGPLLRGAQGALRALVMPDHATPIEKRTHSREPIPFMLWGAGIAPNGAQRFTEVEAKSTQLFIEQGHTLMGRLLR